MKVCEEDTIYDIQRKYKKHYNHHAGSYIWRKDYKNVYPKIECPILVSYFNYVFRVRFRADLVSITI